MTSWTLDNWHLAADADADTKARSEALKQSLEQANARLDVLRAEHLRLEVERQTLERARDEALPLEDACVALERLFDAGLSRQFWGTRADDDGVRAHIADVRRELGIPTEQLRALSEQHRDLLDDIERQQFAVFDIEDALDSVHEDHERKQQEWRVERDETPLAPRLQILPWNRRQEDDRRYRRSLSATLAAALLVALVVPMIDLPLPERDAEIVVPKRLVSLIQKQKAQPLAATVPAKPEPVVVDTPPEVETPEPVPVQENVAKVAEKAVAPSQPEVAQKDVASAGLLAFRERFANLASSRPSTARGADVQINDSGTLASGLPERAMVTSNAQGSSGGINVAALSRDIGSGAGAGDEIEGVALSRVASGIAQNGASDRPLASGARAGRTDEEIQIVFDRYKAALYRLYNRALRDDPTLRGQLVLRLTIEPDGRVSLCQLQDSDMNAPTLAGQVVDRVRAFEFGAKDVPPVTIVYPIDFLPTA